MLRKSLSAIFMSTNERHQALSSVLGDDIYFFYEGRAVYAELLSKDFYFSRAEQLSIKPPMSTCIREHADKSHGLSIQHTKEEQ